MATVTNRDILDAIENLRQKELAEIKNQLKTVDGRVRMTEQAVASFQTWRHNHGKDVHDSLDAEVKSLRAKTNIAGIVLAVGQVATSAWALIVGSK